jgi:hypothetical protein
MAGPNLTPHTFEGGLHKARFPNPDTPGKAGSVGFPNERHSMTLDGTEFWYSNDARGPYDDANAGSGAVCYIDGGARHFGETWPSGGDPFFAGDCDSGA